MRCQVYHGLLTAVIPPAFGINSGSARSISSSTILILSGFFMPPKNRKKVIASSGPSTQGHAGQRKNAVEVTADSGDEFESPLKLKTGMFKIISIPLFFNTYAFLFS